MQLQHSVSRGDRTILIHKRKLNSKRMMIFKTIAKEENPQKIEFGAGMCKLLMVQCMIHKIDER